MTETQDEYFARRHAEREAMYAAQAVAPVDVIEPRGPRVLRHRVSEIYGPVIQGEGALIGCPTVFVRFGGCDYRCSWCDSLHAVDPKYRSDWTPMTPQQIITRCLELSLAGWGKGPWPVITLSGGNPALQPLDDLLELGRGSNLRFALETQGTVAPGWFGALDYLILSPKPPSSGMTFDEDALRACLRYSAVVPTSVKVVVMDVADLTFVGRVRAGLAAEYPAVPLSVQIGNPWPGADTPVARDPVELARYLLARLRWLQEEVLLRGWYDVRVLPQLHTLLYGNERAR